MRRLMAALATAAATFLLLVLATIHPADATWTPPICPNWTLHSVSTSNPTTWTDAPETSRVFDSNTVRLTKPAGGGTEFAANDLGIDLAKPTHITVRYQLRGEASVDGGAIRLFYYHGADANTLVDPPADAKPATASRGTLEINGVEGHIGTIGVTFDDSNHATGSVVFGHLQVGDTPISFTKTPCTRPTNTTTASGPTAGQTTPAQPTTADSAGDAADGSLPITGMPLMLVVGTGIGIVLIGTGLRILARRPNRH